MHKTNFHISWSAIFIQHHRNKFHVSEEVTWSTIYNTYRAEDHTINDQMLSFVTQLKWNTLNLKMQYYLMLKLVLDLEVTAPLHYTYFKIIY